MANIYKIVFAGPVGAGKSTAIETLSDIAVVATEAAATDDVGDLKPTTTVAMDYGLMKLSNGDQVRLYGTPGQKRFDFMWDILSRDALGLVLMLDASAADAVADLNKYVSEFRQLIDDTTLVVGITHTDVSQNSVRHRIADELLRMDLPPLVMDADARNRHEMTRLIKMLVATIDPYLTI
ncbi:MAG TPA: ATP/GTP-binding protein [Wenzhouxiangella sp.]|nr:ATP/GTP-binding protein [Wenzhouxiangella sp.]